jgi:hypothetical protein
MSRNTITVLIYHRHKILGFIYDDSAYYFFSCFFIDVKATALQRPSVPRIHDDPVSLRSQLLLLISSEKTFSNIRLA